MDKAEEASGIVVDLPPTKLEGFGLELLLKKVAAYTPKQFHLAADGDMQVKIVTIFCHQHPSPKFCVTNIRNQNFFVSNICHQNFLSPTSVTNIFATNFLHFHISGTSLRILAYNRLD